MAKSNPQSIVVPSMSVEKLFEALFALPRLTSCHNCGTSLLHVDVTFVFSGGRVWILPLPFCSKCNRVEELASHAA